jgi:hypothetical protein
VEGTIKLGGLFPEFHEIGQRKAYRESESDEKNSYCRKRIPITRASTSRKQMKRMSIAISTTIFPA